MLIERLTPAVGADEARAMAGLVLETVKGYSPTQLVMYADRELLPGTVQQLTEIADRVVAGEPLQYVLGRAWFHGREFGVSPAVLIPRQETSQLIDIISDDFGGSSDLRVLDVGTGSGCIAISLALDLPFSVVTAVDISDEALKVARGNAESLKAKVKFIHADAFALDKSDVASDNYDIIVSNPPYVLDSERKDIDPRVKDYEPSLALFVRDDHPVDIYKAIADFAALRLSPGGALYFEINPLCASQMRSLLSAAGFRDVDIVCDYKGAKRFAIAKK